MCLSLELACGGHSNTHYQLKPLIWIVIISQKYVLETTRVAGLEIVSKPLSTAAQWLSLEHSSPKVSI